MTRIVKVEFLDHVELSDEKLENIKRQKPISCVAYGELIVDAEDYVVVLTCHQDEESQNHAMLVLKTAIIAMSELVEK